MGVALAGCLMASYITKTPLTGEGVAASSCSFVASTVKRTQVWYGVKHIWSHLDIIDFFWDY